MSRVTGRAPARFALVGVINTAIDVVLFMLLHATLGTVLANLVSTTAGMGFSFVANGLFTFGSQRLTLRHALLFLATNGITMWLVQPLVIDGLLQVIGSLLVAKVLAIGASVVLNFAAYRWIVWPSGLTREPQPPPSGRDAAPSEARR